MNLTQSGLVKGKVAYMAPEQVRGGRVDRRTDVWAAGAVAWELFAGRRLHADDDDVQIMFRIVGDDAPSLATVRPNLPPQVITAVDAALSRDPEVRPPSAAVFRDQLLEAWTRRGALAGHDDVRREVLRLPPEPRSGSRCSFAIALAAYHRSNT